MSDSDAMTQPTVHRAALRLLDHQLRGPDGELLGNVDDLALMVSEEGWFVTALQVGPAALGQRLPGRLGSWTVAIWRRLQTDQDPHPAVVPIGEVRDIGSTLTVSRAAAVTLAESFGLERWLRRFVVTRIPGAKGGGDERDDERNHLHGDQRGDQRGDLRGDQRGDAHDADRGLRQPRPRAQTVPPGVSRRGLLSQVIRARVFADDGTELGVVTEVLCAEPRAGQARDHLRVTHLEYGPHLSGARLGYSSDSGQGPLVVGAVVRWWQRGHRVAPVEDVIEVDLDAGTLRVRSHPRHVHPHRL